MAIRKTIPDERDGLYYYDKRAADAACAFFPRYLRLFEGEWAGEPFTLMEWQQEIIRDIFGWKRTSDGTRRYRLVYVWIPRKNTKSTTAAGIALLLLFGDGEPGGQVFTLASTEDQAKIVFNFAGQLIAQSPELDKRVNRFKTAIWCPELGAKIQWLTGKAAGKHGLNASGIIGDEIHEWPSDDLYTFVHQSEGTRRQPMDFLISTAGKRDGVGWEHFQFCEAILNGELDSPATYVFIAAADMQKDADFPLYWTTDEAVRESNPGLGTTVKLEFLQAEIENAKTNPRKVNDIKRYYLNLWVDQATVWLNMARWDICGHKDDPQPTEYLLVNHSRDAEGVLQVRPLPRPILREAYPLIYRQSNMRWRALVAENRGRRCLAGIDLSSTTDLTSFVFLFPPDARVPHWVVIPFFFLPRGSDADLAARIKRDKFDYQAACDVGAIILTEGDTVDYDRVRDEFLAHAALFQLEATAIDRWNALSIAQQLQTEGVEIALFGQGFQSMTAPTKWLEVVILRNSIDHGGHPVLRWNARNAAVSKDGAENMKPVKNASTGRIDGIVATIMAAGISDDYKTEASVYETRGALDAE